MNKQASSKKSISTKKRSKLFFTHTPLIKKTLPKQTQKRPLDQKTMASITDNDHTIDLDAALATATAAAREAGALIAAAWGRGGGGSVVSKSSHVDLVTDTDKAAEAAIRARLSADFPGVAFVGEEEAAERGGEVVLTDAPTWMVCVYVCFLFCAVFYAFGFHRVHFDGR
jgi:hypothetical protein